MSKEKAVSEKPIEERSPMFDVARKVLLAGVGAVALAQDEAETLINKLVERGGVAEQDGRKLMREVIEKRKKGAQRAEAEVDKRFESILGRMNVPTKSDIDALSAKIAALSKKVDELKKPGA